MSTSPLSQSNNFFNGTNDNNGASVTTRNPADLNMLGFDIKNLGASGSRTATRAATINLSSTGDRYFPGVVTTAIKLFAPDFSTSSKTVANLAGRTPALPGDDLEYTVTYPNTGQDAATNVTFRDTLPPGTTFLGATPSGGSCNGAGNAVNCSIGTISVGAVWQATIRVRVEPGGEQHDADERGAARLHRADARPSVHLPGRAGVDRRGRDRGSVHHEGEQP